MKRVRVRARDDIQRELVKTRFSTDTGIESAEWINNFLDRFWLIYEPVLSRTVVASVDQILSTNCPPFLDSLRLSTFTLGTKAPRIDRVKTYGRTEDDVVVMEWWFSFTPNDTSELTEKQKMAWERLRRRAAVGTLVCSSREIYFVDMENCARVSRRLSRDEARVQIAGDDVGGVRGARCETQCRKWPAILRDSGCFVGATECIVGVQRGAGTVGRSAVDRRVRTRRASQKRRRHHGRLRTRTLLSTMISSALSSRAAALLSRRRLLRICDCSVSSAQPKMTWATLAAAWTSRRSHPPLPPPSRTHRSSPNRPGTGTRGARCVSRYSRDRHRARCIWRSCSNATRWRCLNRLVGPSSSRAQ